MKPINNISKENKDIKNTKRFYGKPPPNYPSLIFINYHAYSLAQPFI